MAKDKEDPKEDHKEEPKEDPKPKVPKFVPVPAPPDWMDEELKKEGRENEIP